jgi:hypothetical protein
MPRLPGGLLAVGISPDPRSRSRPQDLVPRRRVCLCALAPGISQPSLVVCVALGSTEKPPETGKVKSWVLWDQLPVVYLVCSRLQIHRPYYPVVYGSVEIQETLPRAWRFPITYCHMSLSNWASSPSSRGCSGREKKKKKEHTMLVVIDPHGLVVM